MPKDNKTTGVEGVGTEGSFHLSKDDKELSVSHLKDRVEYNLKHAEEHLVKAKDACERLHKAGEEANIPRSLLDLTDYFEEKAGHHTEAEAAEMKLKAHIKRSY